MAAPSSLVCLQCRHAAHAPDAHFCLRCGGALAAAQQLEMLSVALFDGPSSAAAPIGSRSLSSLDPAQRARLDYSIRLWDRAAVVCARAKCAKHTAKAMAGFFQELAKIERSYAGAVQKLAASGEFSIETNESPGAGRGGGASLSAPSSALVAAWNALKADATHRGRAHQAFAEQLSAQVESPLSDLRKRLSSEKDALESAINTAASDLRRAQEQLLKLRAKHERLAADFASRGTQGKLTAADVAQAAEAEALAQVEEFKAQNACNRATSESLRKLQHLDWSRIETTTAVLLRARTAQSTMERRYLSSEIGCYARIQAIDPAEEMAPFVDAHASRAPCPWQNSAPVSPQPPTATSAAAASAAAGGFLPVSPAAPGLASQAASVGARAADAGKARKPRGGARDEHGRGHDVLSSSSANNPVIAALSSPGGGAPLPAFLRTLAAANGGASEAEADDPLPFPSLASSASEAMEPLPHWGWVPRVTDLFPGAEVASLPDMSASLGFLSPSASSSEAAPARIERNKLAYEQLLLSTRMLRSLRSQEHVDTITNVVRVSMGITQGEHELMLRVLAEGSGDGDFARREGEASAASSAPDDAMVHVPYRLTLLRRVRSDRFPSLQAYSAWFHRQIRAVWMAVLWSIHSAAKKGSSPSMPMSLRRFKQALQLVQLLCFTLSSKIASKLFVLGDGVADAAHDDLQEQLEDMEAMVDNLASSPAATAAAAGSGEDKKKNAPLRFPQAMFDRLYRHLLQESCVIGGGDDDAPGRKHRSGDRDEDEDGEDSSTSSTFSDDEDDEAHVRLHSNLPSILAALTPVRGCWGVTPLAHQVSLLRVALRVLHAQAQEFDGRLLDADGMVLLEPDEDGSGNGGGVGEGGEGALVPLLQQISSALTAANSSTTEPAATPQQLDADDADLVLYALRNIGNALADFQRFQAKPVAVCLQFYHDVSSWLGVRDVSARVERLLRLSSTRFYHTLLPTEQLLVMKTDTSAAHQRTGSTSLAAATGSKAARIQATPKRLADWTAAEWQVFSKRVTAFVHDQIEEFHPAFAQVPSLRQGLAAPGQPDHAQPAKKAKAAKADSNNPFAESDGEAEGQGEDGASSTAPGQSSLSAGHLHLSEVCLIHLFSCFSADVSSFLTERTAAAAGMDESLLSLVACLVRLQSLAMESCFKSFWSGMEAKTLLARALPDLPRMCTHALGRWMDVQRNKVDGIRERCVSTDRWIAADESAGLLHSHSVTDLFNFLHGLHDAFWSHARSLHGYGVSRSLPSLRGMFQDCLSSYGAGVLASAGLDVVPELLPTRDVKLKQAKAAPTDADKAKAFVKGLFNSAGKKDKAAAAKGDNGDADPEAEEEQAALADLPQRGLTVQSLQSLCVRLCCLEAAIDQSGELSHSVRAHVQAFVADFPLVAPPGVDLAAAADSGAPSPARLAQRWSEWSGAFDPPARMPPPEASSSLFASSLVPALRAQIEQLSEALAVRQVYVEWRGSWLTKLYAPQPLYNNRVKDGLLLRRIEEGMPLLHCSVTRTLFPIVSKHIFVQLMAAVQYVLLYGRRSIQEDQVRNIIEPDVSELRGTFSKIVPSVELDRAMRDLSALLELMAHRSTDELIAMYTNNQPPASLTLPLLARVIAARSGKNAQKLIDKIRGK